MLGAGGEGGFCYHQGLSDQLYPQLIPLVLLKVHLALKSSSSISAASYKMQTPTPTCSSETWQERMICETAAGREIILALKSTALASDGEKNCRKEK